MSNPPIGRGSLQDNPTCPFCQYPTKLDDAKTECPDCRATYHAECWEENGGCGVHGCSQVPETESRDALEIPAAYWGQEHKACPSCGEEILAAALRCRHCGTQFESARPASTEEFRTNERLSQQLPALRAGAIRLFIFSILTISAPFAAVFGSSWYLAHRDEIKHLPSIYRTICVIGLVAGIGQTAAFVLVGVLFAVFRG